MRAVKCTRWEGNDAGSDALAGVAGVCACARVHASWGDGGGAPALAWCPACRLSDAL